MTSSTIVLDLDGTLVDSRPGIEWAVRRAVAETLGDRDLGDVGAAIGGRIRELLRALIPDLGDDEVAAAAAAFRRHYDGEGWRRSVIYDGAPAALAALRAGGATLHIVTNKPYAPTRAVLELTGLGVHVERVVCPDTDPPSADKTEALRVLLERAALDPEQTLYVGDTVEDRTAALAAGMRFRGVAYGYGRAGLETLGLEDLLPDAGALAGLLVR